MTSHINIMNASKVGLLTIAALLANGQGFVNETSSLQLNQSATWALLAWSQGIDSTSGVTVVDLDLFDQKSQIPGLHKTGQQVICYYSAGSAGISIFSQVQSSLIIDLLQRIGGLMLLPTSRPGLRSLKTIIIIIIIIIIIVIIMTMMMMIIMMLIL